MSKPETKNDQTLSGDRRALAICLKSSHNKPLSNERLIQLVKLMARQAAEDDYARSIIQSQPR